MMASPNEQVKHYPNPPYPLPGKLRLNSSVTDYQAWKAHTLYLLRRQGTICFVHGSYLPPLSDGNDTELVVRNPEYDAWRRTDMYVKQGILSLLDPEFAEHVKESKSSRELWLKLHKKFLPHCDRDLSGINVSDNYHTNISTATQLRVALSAGQRAIPFVRDIVKNMPDELIAAKDALGDTALSIAAAIGNKEAVELLVGKCPDLVYMENFMGEFPVHLAAKHAKRDVLIYLISVTKDDRAKNPYAGLSGLALLLSTIQADLYDIALYLVKKYSYLATLKLATNSALKCIAEKKFMFAHGKMYIPSHCLRRTLVQPNNDIGSDINKLSIDTGPVNTNEHDPINAILLLLKSGTDLIFQPVMGEPVKPLVVDIVRRLCSKMKSLSFWEAEDIYRDAILIAAKLGNTCIVETILETFPGAVCCSNPTMFQNIFHTAVENRAEDVYIYLVEKNSDSKHLYLDIPDVNGNNLLHLAAKLAPSIKLAGLPNPALQMHSEMLWYKRVEHDVHPHSRQSVNYAGKTPRMILEEEHKELRVEAEKWVKETGNSCSITAALISTIMFAAAITVPGGNDSSSGFPLFAKNHGFIIFTISDAVSLIASATTLLVFLDMSTSRFAEDDFLCYIPGRLLLGIGSLMISITFMMITFSFTLYIVFGRMKTWVLVMVILLACYIMVYFMIFQLPLLKSLVRSTVRAVKCKRGHGSMIDSVLLLPYSAKFVRDSRSDLHELI